MENIIELKIVPVIKRFYNADSSYGIYLCETNTPEKVMLDKVHNNFSIKGNTFQLKLEKEYNAKLIEREDKKWGTYYEIVSIFESIPTSKDQQRGYLLSVLTKNQVDAIYKAYPNEDIIELIKNDKFDVNKVKGIGLKSYIKVRDKIIENLEFQQAFEFLSQYGVTNNLIIKLVKYFKSAGLLIGKMKVNPFIITCVSGIGFKKADAIAMNMGYDPKGEFRIIAAIEYIVEEESNNGNTYVTTDKLVAQVEDLLGIDTSLINNYIEDTDTIIATGDRVALKKNYNAEKHIAKRLKELLNDKINLNFDPDKFIQEQEEKFDIKLTDQQKQLYHNVKHSRVNILAGFSGTGKSRNVEILINLLEYLKVSYRLLSPTGKAAKVLSNYTKRQAETVHRAIGLGVDESENKKRFIDEEFVIIDESSMVDVQLCARLLKKCTNEDVKLLFIGDPAQIPAVSAGNILHDMLNCKVVPTTQLDIVFRQKEGGALDVITKIRMNEKFVKNDFWGIKEFGENCIVACVPQDKVEGGYQYYFNKYLENYLSDEITIATPTKKSKLGTVEINKHIQEIVNSPSINKKEKETGFDKVIFREGDIVLNVKNSYEIEDVNGASVDIVNGDIGKVIEIDSENEKIIVDFEFTQIPFKFKNLNQLLHCWSMTTHKLQGSSNSVIIVVVDRAHKFQLNSNLLYTACSRTSDKLVIISQAETINYAMRKKANLQRQTFLQEFLTKEGVFE